MTDKDRTEIKLQSHGRYVHLLEHNDAASVAVQHHLTSPFALLTVQRRNDDSFGGDVLSVKVGLTEMLTLRDFCSEMVGELRAHHEIGEALETLHNASASLLPEMLRDQASKAKDDPDLKNLLLEAACRIRLLEGSDDV